jgi:hypothetical protein
MDFLPREVRTLHAYDRLVGEGLAGDDAAGLIGYAVGLPQHDSRWSLEQINNLLFLRDLYARNARGRCKLDHG